MIYNENDRLEYIYISAKNRFQPIKNEFIKWIHFKNNLLYLIKPHDDQNRKMFIKPNRIAKEMVILIKLFYITYYLIFNLFTFSLNHYFSKTILKENFFYKYYFSFVRIPNISIKLIVLRA